MIRNNQTLHIPDDVLWICRILVRAGEQAYVVGGAVRDALLCRDGGDYDIATTATPDKVKSLFRKVIPTGLKHGTVTVLCGKQPYEVTTLRGEGAYSDGRRPDSVEFIDDIESDLARRDFTVNAMAWDPIDERLHDPFGGETDLTAGILRAVGDPEKRFAEDGLRVLRAARFAATLGFEIAEETLCSIPSAAPALKKVSAERKRDELVKILNANKPSLGFEVMDQAGLMPFISGELKKLGDVDTFQRRKLNAWQHTLSRVDALPERPKLRLAGLLLDIGLGEKRSDWYLRSAGLAREWLVEMRFEKKTIDFVTHLLANFGMDDFTDWSEADLRRFICRVGRAAIFDLLELRRADLSAQSDSENSVSVLDDLRRRARRIVESGVPLSVQELAVNGQDLMSEIGIPPGPRVGALLDALLDHVLDHPEVNEKQRLLQRVRDDATTHLS